MRTKLRPFLLLAVAVILAVAFTATAMAAAKNKLKVQAPKSVKIGTNYTVTVSGKAVGNANFLVAWVVQGGKCKSNYGAEYRSLSNPQAAVISMPVSGKFSQSSPRTATAPVGKRSLCAYLINRTTTHTYKHASAHWKDHN